MLLRQDEKCTKIGDVSEIITATEPQKQWIIDNTNWLVGYCRQFDPNQAEDVAQLTAIRFLTHAHAIQVNESNEARAWLAITARREFLQSLRAERKIIPMGTLDDIATINHRQPCQLDDPWESLQEMVETRQSIEDVLNMVQFLPENQGALLHGQG